MQLGDALADRVDDQSARRRFRDRLHADPARYRQLREGARFDDDYLWEEVTRVIIGRGVDRREDYLSLARVGRKRPMPAMVRGLVWDVYQEYLEACAQGDGVMDWNLMLRAALDQAKANGPVRKYAAIIVDEAQDITEVGVRFLLELLDGGPNGRLMLIGDSGQRIYPGGYRLSDLGLETRGRSFALDVCYRSTDEIMQAVGALGRFLSTEEFGDDGLRSTAVTTVRSGSMPMLRQFRTDDQEHGWIIDQLDPDDPAIDSTAILAYTNNGVRKWREELEIAGIGSVGLDEYEGRPLPGVKVGTYHRAKGLEFERLFLPGLDDRFPFGTLDDDTLVESGSVLYVAMSRARDQLVLSYAGEPSLFLEPVQDLCDADGSGD
jgi:superfamily I DNA/RNA helicase